MNLPVAQSILHGALRPGNLPDIQADKLARLFSSLPNNREDVQQLFKEHLSTLVSLEEINTTPVNQVAPDTYTPLELYPIQPQLKLPAIDLKDTPNNRFYKALIRAEAEKIKLDLLYYSDCKQSDIDTKQEVKDTLKNINTYIRNCNEHDNELFQYLRTHLVNLYFELTIIFDTHLQEADFIAFETLVYNAYGRYPDERENALYQSTLHTRQIQKAIKSNKPLRDLIDLYNKVRQHTHTDKELTPLAVVLENFIFLQQLEIPIPGIAFLSDNTFIQEQYRTQRGNFQQRYEKEETANDRIIIIDDIIQENGLDNSLKGSLSIRDQLFSFLAQQKLLYEKDPGAVYPIRTEKTAKSMKSKPRPVRKPMRVEQKLKIVANHCAFMKGYNTNEEKIMSDDDYELMIHYLAHLIKHDEIPKDHKVLSDIKIPKIWIRYTIYLIHQELFTGIQDTWIHFMQAIFAVFSSDIVKFSTLKTKFSQYPSGYNQFVGKD